MVTTLGVATDCADADYDAKPRNGRLAAIAVKQRSSGAPRGLCLLRGQANHELPCNHATLFLEPEKSSARCVKQKSDMLISTLGQGGGAVIMDNLRARPSARLSCSIGNHLIVQVPHAAHDLVGPEISELFSQTSLADGSPYPCRRRYIRRGGVGGCEMICACDIYNNSKYPGSIYPRSTGFLERTLPHIHSQGSAEAPLGRLEGHL